jgi:peptidoglycan/xylan/chitin deacetylase (PgdA/CDA1 family)
MNYYNYRAGFLPALKNTSLFVIITLALVLSPLFGALASSQASTNLIANASAETANADNTAPQNWAQGRWGDNTASFSYLSNDAHDGSRSLKVDMTSYASGDAKWYFAPVAVNGDASYDFTNYYKASVTTYVVAQIDDGNGNYSYQELAALPAASAWTKASATFTTPASAKKVTVFHVIGSVGWLQTDNFSLAATVAPEPSPTNLVANPSMESSANGTSPDGWAMGGWGNNSRTHTYVTNDGHDGSKSLKTTISNYVDGDAKWYFTPVAVSGGTEYTYSDYYKASVTTYVVAQIDDGNGSYTYQDLAAAPASSTWTQIQGSFTAPASAQKVTIFHVINANGWLQIDSASLSATSASNLVNNPSFETADSSNNPAGWHKGNWGSNTASFSYLTTGHTGTRSAKVEISQYTNGDAKWYFAPIPVEQHKAYKFSNYYKSNAETYVTAVFRLSDGSTVYPGMATLSPSAGSDWAYYEDIISVPADAVDVTVYHVVKSVGWLTVDDYSLQPYVPQGFSEPLVTITFDDGYASAYTEALPLLQKYGLNSTQYVVSGLIGQWNYMTEAMVKDMHAAGQEISSHTVTHADLTQLSSSELHEELSQSKAALEQLIGAPVPNMASPFGSYNANVIDAVKQYYGSHRSVESGFNDKSSFDPYNIKVQNIGTATTTAQVQEWLAHAKETSTWLVLVYHNIKANPSSEEPYTISPEALDAQLSAVKTSGIQAKTLRDALAAIQAQL